MAGTNPPHRMRTSESFGAVLRLLFASLILSAPGATAAVELAPSGAREGAGAGAQRAEAADDAANASASASFFKEEDA